MQADNDWYKYWFNEWYLRIYPHRDHKDAERDVNLLLSNFGEGVRPVPILDIGCGTGRHMALLKEKGLPVFGLDYSMPLLRRAGTVRNRTANGDIRNLPFKPGTFNLITSFFTSFGYFTDDREHALVLDQVSVMLKTGGHFYLDIPNPEYLRGNLAPDSIEEKEGFVLKQERRLSGGRVEKTIIIKDGKREHRFFESVRLFLPDEITGMLKKAGFRDLKLWGNNEGDGVSKDAARIIILASKY